MADDPRLKIAEFFEGLIPDLREVNETMANELDEALEECVMPILCYYLGHELVPSGCLSSGYDYCRWCWESRVVIEMKEYKILSDYRKDKKAAEQ